MLAVAIALVLAGVLLGAYTLQLGVRGIAGAILSTAALGAIGPALQSPCDAETSYHCVSLLEAKESRVASSCSTGSTTRS